jgi:two-component system, NarL family, response regulator DesR
MGAHFVSDATPAEQGIIRVVVAEDQAMVLGALAALLGLEPDIRVVAQARNGAEALRAVREQSPDVLITDIEMPEMTGIELARALKGQSAVKVVVVTTFARPGYLRRAIDAGAMGYLLKDSPARELASAVRRVQQGHRVIDSELAAEALGEPDPLTDRERQVLRLAADGATSEDIAGTLGLSEGTVRNYLSEAIGKLGAVNRVDASRIARQKGWL